MKIITVFISFQAQSLDPFHVKNMDLLSYMYYRDKKDKELET